MMVVFLGLDTDDHAVIDSSNDHDFHTSLFDLMVVADFCLAFLRLSLKSNYIIQERGTKPIPNWFDWGFKIDFPFNQSN